ncbi:MAG TPA: hypothetical protein PK765_02550 [bacterium]|nr:hypothetical protein [bacterium]
MNLRHGRTKYLVRLLCVIAGLWLAPSAVSAAIVDCATFDTGGNACEVCATDRYYLGEGFWMWDWFYNNFP